MQKPVSSGFTLIELSIVLVVIGLIIGGVLVGQTLIVASQARQAIKDLTTIGIAINTFRDKYNCLPGDCGNATTFLPACTDAGEWYSGYYNSCNGNGNGSYDSPSEGTVRFWQHLSLANMIAGTYPGLFGTAITPGTNVPYFSWADGSKGGTAYGASINNISIFTATNAPEASQCYQCVPGAFSQYPSNNTGRNELVVMGTESPAILGGQQRFNSAYGLKSSFASMIDQKFDDGLPLGGSFRDLYMNTGSYYVNTCNGSNPNDFTQPYTKGTSCAVIYILP